jgi:hypothetical protein
VNQDSADLRIAELLSAIGQVAPATSRAVQEARDALWSAVAGEMLRTTASGDTITRSEANRPPRTARRGRANHPHDR